MTPVNRGVRIMEILRVLFLDFLVCCRLQQIPPFLLDFSFAAWSLPYSRLGFASSAPSASRRWRRGTTARNTSTKQHLILSIRVISLTPASHFARREAKCSAVAGESFLNRSRSLLSRHVLPKKAPNNFFSLLSTQHLGN